MADRPDDFSLERALIQRALANEERAIQELAHRLRSVPRILAAENRRRGRPLDDHDLADLVQDSVVVILRKLHDLAIGVPLDGWIYRVCRLEFMNGLRRKWRRRGEGLAEVDANGLASPARDTLADRDAIHCALARLEPEESAVVQLKHFEGLSFPEIAARLELSPNTCKTRYYRGLTRLERLLREGEEG